MFPLSLRRLSSYVLVCHTLHNSVANWRWLYTYQGFETSGCKGLQSHVIQRPNLNAYEFKQYDQILKSCLALTEVYPSRNTVHAQSLS